MILIEEDKLIHTDSSEDILLHFGTKGMKWGVRKAVRAAGNVGKIYANSYTHPLLSSKAKTKTNLQYLRDKKKYKADKKKLKAEYANKEDRNAALKKLKANYKKNNSTTGLLERQVRNLENNKAAKVQYANDKAKATTKEEKRNAKAKYKKAINPLNY
jgi:hypothetical protein